MTDDTYRNIALDVFSRIQQAFPHLKMNLELNPEHVDLALDIPEQEGLGFSIGLNLQWDELHLQAGAFWLEWFPCQYPEKSQAYFNAVCGLISGRFRILEHCRGNRVVKAWLQEPDGAGWKTIGRWSSMHLPLPWLNTTRELRNTILASK